MFLAKKDPEFFRDAIRPYLANKKDKTFIDRWLLGEPLNAYLEPWNHGQLTLNVAERILLGERIANEPRTARGEARPRPAGIAASRHRTFSPPV